VSTSHPRPSWLKNTHRVAFVGLLVMLAWVPLPLASNRGWAVALLSLVLCSLLLLVLATAWVAGVSPVHTSHAQQNNRPPWVPLALLAAYTALVAFQLLPLPEGLRAWLAPGSTGPGPVSVDPFATGGTLLLCGAYLSAFALVVLLVRSEERLRWLLLVVVGSGVFQAIVATFLFSQRDGYEFLFMRFPPGDRATGTFASFDHLAGYMEICLALGLGLMLSSVAANGRAPAGWRNNLVQTLQFVMSAKMLVRLLLITMVIALVLTRSRGGNAAFFIALFVTGALVAWRSPQLRRLTLIVVTSMLVIDLLIIGQWVGLDKVVQRLQGTALTIENAEAREDRGLNLRREETIEERLFAAEYTLNMVKERPLLGFGGGSFYVAFPRFKGEHPLGFYDHAHNDYVEVAATTGLLGLGLLLSLCAAAFWRAVRALDDKNPPLARGMAAGVVMAITSLAIHSVVDFNLQIPANALTFTTVLALAWCLPVRTRRRSGRSQGDAQRGGDSDD
jgi:O-antigen ligase